MNVMRSLRGAQGQGVFAGTQIAMNETRAAVEKAARSELERW